MGLVGITTDICPALQAPATLQELPPPNPGEDPSCAGLGEAGVPAGLYAAAPFTFPEAVMTPQLS